MTTYVADTSVLIDLGRGGLLEAAFGCGLPMVVPDLLYELELKAEGGEALQQLGLVVVSLRGDEVDAAQRLHHEGQGLSLPDCFALICAARPQHVLLSGDQALREEALVRLGDVRGLLWVLDMMASSGHIRIETLHDGLKQLAGHQRARLPRPEVNARLKTWATLLKKVQVVQ